MRFHRSSASWVMQHRGIMVPWMIGWAMWACQAVAAGAAQPPDTAAKGETLLFEDKFADKLAEGWSWERGDPTARRVAGGVLQIRVQPGGMWGGGNNAKNVLVRKMPETSARTVAVEVTVSDQPSRQYEQAGIAWYYDGSNMIKLVKEYISGKVNVVMGREQADRPRTIAVAPLEASSVQLRLRVTGNQVTAQFRPDGKGPWKDLGTCDSPGKGPAKVSLQAYNGPADAEHWARFKGFRIIALEPRSPR